MIDCAGQPEVLGDALRHVKAAGTVVAAGVYGQRVGLSLDRIVGQELVLRGSFGYIQEFAHVIELLGDGALDAESFISGSLRA